MNDKYIKPEKASITCKALGVFFFFNSVNIAFAYYIPF